jgi:hypothetical protein
MYQAYDQQLLNQKESESDSSMQDTQQHPLYVATRRLVNALDRLEGNLKHVVAASDQDVDKEQQVAVFERENAALRHCPAAVPVQ